MKARTGFVSNSSSSSFLLLLPHEVAIHPEGLQDFLFGVGTIVLFEVGTGSLPDPSGKPSHLPASKATKIIRANLGPPNQTDRLDSFLTSFCAGLPEGNSDANQLLWDAIIARAKATLTDYYILTLHSDGDEEESLLCALVKDGLLNEFQLLSMEEK